MDYWPLIAAIALGGFALMTRILSSSPVTMPMVCIALGMLLFAAGGVPFDLMDNGLTVVAEVTLAVVLFTDASSLTLAQLRSESGWPSRMLLVGLPLAIVLGTLAFLPIFPDMPFWQIALIAALLAPTDAALGQAVFTNKRVPQPIREALTTESGLNDGLSLPAIIFIACAAVGFDHDLNQSSWVLYAMQQIAVALATGWVLGAVGGWASHMAIEKGLAIEDNSAIFALLLIAITYFAADALGGNSFVAVFVAGLFFGKYAKSCARRAREFLETEGVLLIMAAFLFIGALMIPPGLATLDWQVAVAVLLSLFAVRPLAIWLSMIGTGATNRTKLFLGWFGPRGLATALFTLLVLAEFEDKLMSERIMAVTAFAVLLSTLVHGVSAHYAARLCDDGAGESSRLDDG